MNTIEQRAVNALRVLSADQVQKANSGHPGLPLGAAPMAYELWAEHLNHNPLNPDWKNRDRFILSAGHGSALLYSLLHLFEYEGMTKEELQNFRQWDSATAGHPEYGHAKGIEATTGPLGAGMSNAVGMAMAEAFLAETFNEDGYPVVDHHTYVLGGDGCMMEGITSEAMSLAGSLQLSKLIVFYDSNSISIEGDTDTVFREDVGKRFEAYGFHVLRVEDGTDLKTIGAAIAEAKAETEKPSLIIVTTQIGYGVPAKAGKASAHGEPLGIDNVAILRANLQWEEEEAFFVPEEIRAHYRSLAQRGRESEERWNDMMAAYANAFPEKMRRWEQFHSEITMDEMLAFSDIWEISEKAEATRSSSGIILNALKDMVPNLIGGSADLAPSNQTLLKGEASFLSDSYDGRNLHFGVRELAMTGIVSGIALHGGLRAYAGTFLVFSDYMKPMIRLAALMGLPVIYVLTHDSIGVGEDGPTHEPIEHLSMLRATPNLNCFRPADRIETAAAYSVALSSERVPTALALTRQKLPTLDRTSKEAIKGGYVIQRESKNTIDLILMASGSELNLVLDAHKILEEQGHSVRVVSMPCMDLFAKQDADYQESVLPRGVRNRLAVEAASSQSWYRYVGMDGDMICIDHFGASAPGEVLFEKYGFTVENVLSKAHALLLV